MFDFLTILGLFNCIIVLSLTGTPCSGASLFSVNAGLVKLWSVPNSRATIEKGNYDSHFVPFYRTEQLIISRPYNTTIISWQNLNYTSIFDKSFLHELLDLQNNITEIQAEYDNTNFTLQDICFAPLMPDNNNCTIQSILNYYQNSHEMIDKVVDDGYGWIIYANYLNHFESCVQSPCTLNDTSLLHTPCLGPSGVPVSPWVVVGGFKGTEYRTAKAFIFTILVNNHVDKSKTWEAKLVSFIKNYTAHHPDIHIAFSSEVNRDILFRTETQQK